MKTLKTLLLILILSISFINSNAQENSDLPSMVFIEFDTRSVNLSSYNSLVTGITRIELDKLGKYKMMDQYDLEYLIGKDSLKTKNCFSRICLTEIGNKLKVDKMFSGTIAGMGDQLIITLRIVDVKTGEFEKTQVNEFLDIPAEIKNMIRISVNDMFGIANDQQLVAQLTKKFEFDNAINNPHKIKLRSDGPRMGFTCFTGDIAKRLQEKTNEGGFNASPVMFQFGYQFEKQYLNEGNFQALFEFIPMLTGLDQGYVIPGLTMMNGLRNNKNGWEFAFGPSVSVVTKAMGYYDDNNKWQLASERDPEIIPESRLERRLDSRGDAELQPGFVFAFGKTFKSGRLNIPVNGYVIPGKDGLRYGLSFGFNAKDRYQY